MDEVLGTHNPAHRHHIAQERQRQPEGYQAAAAPRWWKLNEDDREHAMARLRAWVDQVYRPSYGHLAGALGPCWDQHPLCLYGLDWLMELWSVLYLTPKRDASSLASQAEWQTRLLPALAEQLYLETTHCQHAQPAGDRRASPSGGLATAEAAAITVPAPHRDQRRRNPASRHLQLSPAGPAVNSDAPGQNRLHR